MKSDYRPLTISEREAMYKLLACLSSDVPCFVGKDSWDSITNSQAVALDRLGYVERDDHLVSLTQEGCRKAILLKRMYKYEA